MDNADKKFEIYRNIKIENQGLVERIANKIQELIISRELKQGDKLPPDRTLSELMNVSRPTVREALRLLQHRGLVKIKPGSGTTVTIMGVKSIIESMDRFFSMSEGSFKDLMQVRKLLEPGTAALAAKLFGDGGFI